MNHNRLFSGLGVAAAFAAISTGSALAAGQPERTQDPFVCPVLTLPDGALSSGQFNSIGNGQYTFAPGNAGSAETFNGNVPNIATNADGSGSPGGAHSAPGDTDYTAIWSGN
jgi:ABC-type phosphate transport system substrate-binding protein